MLRVTFFNGGGGVRPQRSAASALTETSKPKYCMRQPLNAHKTYDMIANVIVETLNKSSGTSTKRCGNLKARAHLTTVLCTNGN